MPPKSWPVIMLRSVNENEPASGPQPMIMFKELEIDKLRYAQWKASLPSSRLRKSTQKDPS